MDTLTQEMKNVWIAFDILPHGQKAPSGLKKKSGHLVWDLKKNFTRKAPWVKDRHKTPNQSSSTFFGVTSRESVCIVFPYAVLDDLDV